MPKEYVTILSTLQDKVHLLIHKGQLKHLNIYYCHNIQIHNCKSESLNDLDQAIPYPFEEVQRVLDEELGENFMDV